MQLTIDRPKDIDLEDLFGLRLRLVPARRTWGFTGPRHVASKATHSIDLVIGQRHALFWFHGADTVDGFLLIWPDRKEWCPSGEPIHLARGDEIAVTMTWNLA
jgi:hypothetical protein